jgi:hypothetical protein
VRDAFYEFVGVEHLAVKRTFLFVPLNFLRIYE